jgi:hypothetical protein
MQRHHHHHQHHQQCRTVPVPLLVVMVMVVVAAARVHGCAARAWWGRRSGIEPSYRDSRRSTGANPTAAQKHIARVKTLMEAGSTFDDAHRRAFADVGK